MKSLHVIGLVSLLTLSSSISIFGCACCIDPGYYEISTLRPSDYDLSTLNEFKYDTAAEIYEDAAGFDGIKGLDSLRKVAEVSDPLDFTFGQTFASRTWRFSIRSSTGDNGTLVLPMPRSMVKFKVDMHDNEPNTEPGLYKEFRFKGTVASGTGMFRPDVVRGTSYFLVFQGRGNGCDSSSDFTHWRLEVDGPKANYAFFGKLMP